MSIEVTDCLSASVVVVGVGLLGSEQELKSFSDSIPTEIVVENRLGPEGSLGRRLQFNKDRILIEITPQRSSIRQEYPSDDLSILAGVAGNAIKHTTNVQDIRAHGYNVDLVYAQNSAISASSYIAKRMFSTFPKNEAWKVIGGHAGLRFQSNDGRMWIADIEPRFRQDDTNKIYFRLNLHVQGRPDTDTIHDLLRRTRHEAEGFVARLDG